MAALNVNVWEMPEISITTIYNDTAQHSLPIVINLLSNAFYRLENCMYTSLLLLLSLLCYYFHRICLNQSQNVLSSVSLVIHFLFILVVYNSILSSDYCFHSICMILPYIYSNFFTYAVLWTWSPSSISTPKYNNSFLCSFLQCSVASALSYSDIPLSSFQKPSTCDITLGSCTIQKNMWKYACVYFFTNNISSSQNVATDPVVLGDLKSPISVG
jgi:hypothetical protein